MSPPRVVGLDLSLRATGVALSGGEVLTLATKDTGCERLIWLRERSLWASGIGRWSVTEGRQVQYAADLVVIEDYAYSRGNQAHQIGELGGVIRLALHEAGVPFVVVGTGQLKKYATGNGGCDKAAMILAAYKRGLGEFTDDNQADAAWLRIMGLDALGHPVCEMPKVNRAVLAKVAWPAPAEAVKG